MEARPKRDPAGAPSAANAGTHRAVKRWYNYSAKQPEQFGLVFFRFHVFLRSDCNPTKGFHMDVCRPTPRHTTCTLLRAHVCGVTPGGNRERRGNRDYTAVPFGSTRPLRLAVNPTEQVVNKFRMCVCVSVCVCVRVRVCVYWTEMGCPGQRSL